MRTAWLMVALLLAPAAHTHHSFAQYDATHRLTLVGVVKEFQWTNPHVYLEMYVLNEVGEAQTWLLESSSPNQLTRAGWSRTAIHVGDRLTVEINLLKSGQRGGWLIKCVLPDGRSFGG
jgi:hypothetical protein